MRTRPALRLDWLTGDRAAGVFTLCAVLLIVQTAEFFHPSTVGTIGHRVLNVLGILSALSFVTLWVGMTAYQRSAAIGYPRYNGLLRLLLFVGLWYGPILYFLTIYLWTRKRKHGMGLPPPPHPMNRRTEIGGFGYILGALWIAFFLLVVSLFTIRDTYKLIRPLAAYFQLIPMTLLLITAIYVCWRVIRGGSHNDHMRH